MSETDQTYDPEKDISDAQLAQEISMLRMALCATTDASRRQCLAERLQCMLELQDWRKGEVEPRFMSKPGDWLLAAALTIAFVGMGYALGYWGF